MESRSETESCAPSGSQQSVTRSTRSQEENMSQEEQTLSRTLEKGIEEATDENHAFTKEISSLLTKLGLEPNTLALDVKESLEKVCPILKAEQLRDFDDISLQIARCRKEVETVKKRREENKLRLAYDDLHRKYTAFSKEFDYLHNAIKALENDVETAEKSEENKYSSDVQLEMKLGEYQKTVKNLESDITEMQVGEVIPDKIMEKYNKYLELSSDLADLNREIDEYAGLPPHMVQAKIIVEAKQKEYESLEKEFLEKLNS